ncbi:membrane protein YczE [Streptomonospora sediminis]
MQLYAGLCVFGLGCALLIASELGAMPWDVLHQGLAHRTGLSVGTCSILAAGATMLLWVPLRQRVGLGTVSNAIVVGLAVDTSLWLLPEVHGLAARWAVLAAGILLTGLATGCYIGAQLGPGPRDGVMVGLAAHTRLSVRMARTAIEIAVVIAGTLLGGTLGVGTVLFAVAIGPLAQLSLPLLTVPAPPPAAARTDG